VHDLADKAHEHPDRAPVWQDIRQVEFNAWEYVQGNVWAGLLERIFATLGTLPERTSVVDAVRAPVTVALEAAQRSVSDAETERAQSTDAVAAKREEVLDAEARVRERRFDALERWAAQDGTAAAARDVLATYWQEHRAALLGKDGAELVEALGEVGGELRGGRALLGPYWRQPWRVVAVTAGLVLACVVAGLLAVAPLPPGVSFFGGLAALVPVVTTTLRSAASWSAKVRLAVEEARGKLREGLARSVEREERRAAAARAELADALAERDAADARLRAANEHHAALARRLGELTPARVLVEFADKRGEDYRRLLGPLATIREDIRAVEQQILNHNRDGTGVPNRIVLYIDDLDRCPPRTVVEVLEAIHLLLSFQIFVVVAAVDQRWLTAALLDQLPSLGPGRGRSVEHAGPAEYLEKIFQLPFLVRSLPDGARGQMLRGLLAPSVRDTQVGTANGHSHGLRVGVTERDAVDVMLARRGAGVRLETSALTLTSGDLKTIESFAPLIGDTPRRVKRFVNVCQLLLAMPPRLGDQRTGDREVVCFLAAVSEGLPTVAAALFAALQSTEVSAAKLIDWKPWGGVDPDEWNTLKAWVRAQPPSWSGTTLTRLSAVAPRIDMIHRMRFTELPEISTG
jgi:hypothetical protein